MTTTNGAQLFSIAPNEMTIAICSLLNVATVAQYLVNQKRDIAILCAGKFGEFGLEDVVCGGMLIRHIAEEMKDIELNDGAIAALKLCEAYSEDILAMLRESNHGRRLIDINLMQDLRYASQVNKFDILPLWENGNIELLNSN